MNEPDKKKKIKLTPNNIYTEFAMEFGSQIGHSILQVKYHGDSKPQVIAHPGKGICIYAFVYDAWNLHDILPAECCGIS